MKILFITQICPFPPTNGGAIKTYNILKHLGKKHDVRLLAFIRRDDEIPMLYRLSDICETIDYSRITRSKMLNVRYAFESLVHGKSFIVARDYDEKMRAEVADAVHDGFDLIYVDHLQMFQFVPENPPCPVLLDEHNVEWRIIERFAENGSGAHRIFASLEWKKLRTFELDACRRADMVFTVTPDDRDTLAQHGVTAEKIVHIPIGVDTDFFRPVDSKPGDTKVLSFGTMSWPPNADAAIHFSKSIYPLVKNQVPDAHLTLVGSNPTREVEALAGQDTSIKVTGFVPDLREAAHGTAAFVVPLRIGSGMRVKILDAMAMGLPVVTTSVGCEGISIEPGKHALVADTPEEFADSVVRLITDYDTRSRLAESGRSLVEERYSWPPILQRLDQALSCISH